MKILAAIIFLFGISLVHADTPKVIVHLLDHTGKQETKSKFWIDWNESWRGIVTTKEASEEESLELVTKLREALSNTEAEHFCGHDPIYAVDAIDAEGKRLKTSLCFTCLTWVKPKKRLYITGQRGKDNELCQMLREIIELPDELLAKDTYQTTTRKAAKPGEPSPSIPSD